MALPAMLELLDKLEKGDKDAEQQLLKAISDSPDDLCKSFCSVLVADAPSEKKEQAAHHLRSSLIKRRNAGSGHSQMLFTTLSDDTMKGMRNQLLICFQSPLDNKVRRAVGNVISFILNTKDDFDEVQSDWPEVLPLLSQLLTSADVNVRLNTVEVLQDTAATIGAGLLQNGGKQALGQLLIDQSQEVRAAGAKLLLEFIEEAPAHHDMLVEAMPYFIKVLQGLAESCLFKELRSVLERLASVTEDRDEEYDDIPCNHAEFFKDESFFDDFWSTMMQLGRMQGDAEEVTDVRVQAMETLVNLLTNSALTEDFVTPEGKPYLEAFILLTFSCFLSTEEDVTAWTENGKDENEDDLPELEDCAMRNMDSLGENIDMDKMLPIVFRIIQEAPKDWKHTYAGLLTLSQIAEYIDVEEEGQSDWAKRTFEYIAQFFDHEHPRVRHMSFYAFANGMGNADSDELGETVLEYITRDDTMVNTMLAAIAKGMKDDNIRVRTMATETLECLLNEDVEYEEHLEGYMDDMLRVVFVNLDQNESKGLRNSCLDCVGYLAKAAETSFQAYYSDVIAVLKKLSAHVEDKELKSKTFLCIAYVGAAVGKDMYLADGCEVMTKMMDIFEAGFDGEDLSRDNIYETIKKNVDILGSDCEAIAPRLLPPLFKILNQRPQEAAANDSDFDYDDDEEKRLVIGDKTLRIKTAISEEMVEALDLLTTFIEILDKTFGANLEAICTNLLPLLDIGNSLNEAIHKGAFETFKTLVKKSREATIQGQFQQSHLQTLVTQFLKQPLLKMHEVVQKCPDVATDYFDDECCLMLEFLSEGVAGVLEEAGQGVLAKEVVVDMVSVVGQLLNKIICDEKTVPGRRRKKVDDEEDEDDEDDEDDDDEPTPQSVRYALIDILSGLMRTNCNDFAEVALHDLMGFVCSRLQADKNECDRCLALHIAAAVISAVGKPTVQYWNNFMNQAYQGMSDKSWYVRQYASLTISSASALPDFAPMAQAAVSTLYSLLEKLGERHRRRKQTERDKMQMAFGIDTYIFALGQIMEHHEQLFSADADKVKIWSMWLNHLPLKYDTEAGQKALGQLLSLVGRSHPVLSVPALQEQVFNVLLNAWNTKWSSKEIDKRIVAGIGEETLLKLKESCPENKQKKVEQMLKAAKRAGG